MARTKKHTTKTVDGILYILHPKTLGKGDEKKTIGYSAFPAGAEKCTSEEEARAWLEDLVENGVLTWLQIAKQGLYNVVLVEHRLTLQAYSKAAAGEGFNLGEAMALYHDEAVKSGAIGWKAVEAEVKRLWERDKRGDISSWNAEEHVLFPKDAQAVIKNNTDDEDEED